MFAFWARMSARGDSDERLPGSLVGRLEGEASAAIRRKPAHESHLSGALRVLAPYSRRLLDVLGTVVDTMVQRGALTRPLYTGGARALAAAGGERAVAPLQRALGREDAGGLATLSAACFTRQPELAEAIARVAVRRQPHLAFAAEVARLARGESNGEHIASIAPKIKESHRIALCVEVLVPLLWRIEALPVAIAPALDVLRSAERHLGRWLVFGELEMRAGDDRPLCEARQRAQEGPSSARAAWALVAWALAGAAAPAPSVRPTAELVARLSDRPSADRDMTFLFRLAAAGVPSARPMLDSLAKGSGDRHETALRAIACLAQTHGRTELREKLADAAANGHKEALRGLASAALFDTGDHGPAVALAEPLVDSRVLPTAAWGALVLMARDGLVRAPLVNEPAFRWIQLGCTE
ncbi:MAG: hypothetical protein JW940_14765 [Polyangiaceae bacterium]|nr:hypothetical protein [Polyangiaceae bacterium]